MGMAGIKTGYLPNTKTTFGKYYTYASFSTVLLRNINTVTLLNLLPLIPTL
jgi:hypothetical protein